MPKVSVVIPTKNRAALVAQAIDCIETQSVPRSQYEVIVIDNDSSDNTHAILEQKAKTYSNLKIGFQDKPGAAATRNTGLLQATGDIVLFVDDDIQAEPELIQAHLDAQAKNPNSSVIGAMTMPWGDTSDPFLRYLRDHRILNPYTPSKGAIDFSYYHTCNVSTPTEMLLRVGGFNENFRWAAMEDIELGYRVEKAGCRMLFAGDARAVHYRFPDYEDFIHRSEQAGYSLGQLLRLHPELKSRFVDRCRIARHLKSIHPLYRWLSVAMAPFIKLLMAFEKARGTKSVTRAMDAHYNWSIRYHFFLGYHRYSNDRTRPSPEVVAPLQPALAKKYQVKAKGEL